MIKKIPDVSGSVTTTVLNRKVSNVQNKIPDTSGLLTTTVLNTKIGEVENNTTNNNTDHPKCISCNLEPPF